MRLCVVVYAVVCVRYGIQGLMYQLVTHVTLCVFVMVFKGLSRTQGLMCTITVRYGIQRLMCSAVTTRNCRVLVMVFKGLCASYVHVPREIMRLCVLVMVHISP